MMKFVTFDEVREIFNNKSVAIIGSAPCILDNEIGFIDSHDIVVRVNNFKLTPETGYRTDVFYSFFGVSIRGIDQHLTSTYLCMCKCPNYIIDSPWHDSVKRMINCDFTQIYKKRKNWWFCDVFVPEIKHFEGYLEMLDGHVPTTGFNAILDISQFDCEIYLTGFDFFKSGIHRVNEKWLKGNPDDPLGHRPEREKEWILDHANRFTFDEKLNDLYLQREEVS